MKQLGILIRVVVCAGLMAGGQVWAAVIANYQGDYRNGSSGQTRPQVSNDGWDYMWNSGGPIGTATNYSSLIATGSSYNYDGGSLPRAEPAAYVYLSGSGGHPGRGSTQSGGVGNTIDRYAIAAYTVQPGEAGHVYLANGSIYVGSLYSNGVEVRVYVNDTLKLTKLQLGGAPTGYFGAYLGYLNVGDTVYVAMGPNTHDGSDGFSSFQFVLIQSPTLGDRWWDADGTSPVGGGTGPWNTTNSYWADAPSGGTYSPWNNTANMTAHFTGTGGTVSLAEPITVRSMGFYTNGYTIAGSSTLTLTQEGASQYLDPATIYVENAPDTATISAPIAGSAGLTKTGAGTLVLANSANTYTGTTLIRQGTLKLGATNAIPRINDSNVVNLRLEDAVLDLNGYNEALHRIVVLGGTIQTGTGQLELTYSNSSFTSTTANSTLIAGTVKMTPNWGYFTFEVSDGPKDIDVEVSAKLTGTASSAFYKDQPGTLLLSSSQSDFTANTIIVRRGRLFIGANAPKGAPGALGNNNAPIQLGDSLTDISRGVWTYGAVTVGRDIVVYSAPSYAAYIGGYTAHTSYFTGNITLWQNVELQAASGGTVYFTGQIIESGGSYGITKTGDGTVVLQNTANSFSGPVTVSGGVLSVPTVANSGQPSPLGAGSAITLGSATLQYSGATAASTNRTITLTGGGTIDVSNSAGQLTLSGTLSGSGQTLTKTGGGTLEISGSATLGTLRFMAGTTKFAGNASLTTSRIDNRGSGVVFSIADNASITVSSYMVFGDASGASITINQSGGAVTNLGTVNDPAGNNMSNRWGHWAGGTTTYNLSGGVLNLLAAPLYLSWDGPATLNISGGTANILGINMGYGGRTNPSTISLTGGRLNIGSAGIITGGTSNKSINLGGGTLGALANWSSSLPMTLTGINGNTTINTSDPANPSVGYIVTLSGVLSGDGGLVKTGAGILQLNAYNTFTGGTVVEAGTLLLTAGGANGTLTGELTVNAGATVNYTASNAFGWNAGASVNKLNINGGTVGGNDVPNHFWNSFQLTMTGGVLYQGGDASVQYNEWHNPTITILESAQTAQMLAVSANAAMRIRDNTWAKFDVCNGPADVDLLVDIPITYQTGSSGITKIGEGVMKVQKNINIANLYVAGGNLVLAGDSTSSADFLAVGLSEPWVVGGSSPATLTIQDNASLTVRAVHMGENYQNPIMGMIAEIRQTGGTFTVTGYNEDPGSPTPYNKGALRIGHWPNETSTYYLSGGNLVIQNAEAGILLATEGNGTFYQTGGTANATFVKLNTRPSGGGTGIFTLEGGTFIMGSGGFVTDAGPYQLNLGGAGPTLRAAADWASSLNMTLSGTGTNAIHFDTNGYTVTLSGKLTGAGGLNKVGPGTLAITSTSNDFTGPTNISGGVLSVANGRLYNASWLDRSISITNGAVLEVGGWADGDSLGIGYVSFNSANILIDGGTIRYTAASYNNRRDRGFTIGANGATLEAAGIIPWVLSAERNFPIVNTSGGNLTLTGSADGQIDKVIPGTGQLIKSGTGTWILTAANTYSGGTTVLAGRLLVNNTSGSGTGTGDVVVQGGLLGGNGAIGGNVLVQAGAAISAGNSPGHLTIQQNYTQQDEGTLLVELAGYTQGGTQALPGQWAANGYDWLSVGGQAVLDGYLQIELLAGFRPASGDTFDVLTAAGGIDDLGLVLQWNPQDLLPGQYWTYRILTGQGTEEILQLQLGVPEPASLVLLVLGAAGLLLARRFLAKK